MNRLKGKKGWTLIELIAVIVILGIIAAVAIPAYLNLTSEAEKASCKANQAAIRSAVYLYYAKNKGQLPTQLDPSMFVNKEIPQCPTYPADSIAYTYNATDSTFKVTCSKADHN
jgi:prepilin-type N-terminal cleavage/methylation domain-containing protein